MQGGTAMEQTSIAVGRVEQTTSGEGGQHPVTFMLTHRYLGGEKKKT